MRRAFARIRVDTEEADLLIEILKEARFSRVGAKIAERERGRDPIEIRQELAVIRRMIEEVHRAKDDIAEEMDGG